MENSVTDQPLHPSEARLSPLDAVHVAAGAAFTDFAGWKMPVRYGSDLAEHETVRTAAGLFDLSHMAEFLVGGTHAAAFLDFALAGQASVIAPGRAKYSLLLAENGGILDDLVVYRLDDQHFWVVANAANHEVVAMALAERRASFDAIVDDETANCALIAIQGPEALAVLGRLESLSGVDLQSVPYYGIAQGSYGDANVLVARTGYTGEDGFELYLDVAAAPALWNDLVAAGAVACGLAARDTLRLEAGMPLYGHELSRETFPVQAGIGRVVALGKPGDFVGRAAVEAGPPVGARVLVGLTAEGKRAGRAEYPVLRDGGVIGEVTSGALSPTLGIPIAMAYVDPDAAAIGTELSLDVRGTAIPARVVSLPFYSRKAVS
ncbi:glycine cleavage system aminomethyltransferase GcvT [Pseudolysinimonas sp.]|uniref:glycine cleavage system aminomethyltransferase GcvT n=1 Tax=Pseudolysinimonas sp. TaxID=2680009 RepID=UPI00286B062F|nr:glycine cleavage system aminomethyltransferase GcvT [Pseudolysinimonas sp.]